MSVFLLCEQAIGLVRGKRLILSSDERSMLESLDYEGLAAVHAQDEAVVCALHFARVRDRLLQAYAWTFARKEATLSSGGSLPSDYLAMLYVLVDGEPVDYEVSGAAINITTSAEIHYTARITDTTKWSSIFNDVFCYALAVEICAAVTGKPEYAQILEQKEQELIHRAIQIGEIKAEVKLSLTQEIYNRAIGLARGQRTVAPTSAAATEQGLDNAGIPNDKIQAEVQACKRAADSVRDRLLGLYPWTFARKSVQLSQVVTTIDGWNYGYKRPDDCMKVLTVLSNGEPIDFEETEAGIFVNSSTPTIRYTSKITSMNSWSGSFIDVFVCELAQEVVIATTHNLDTAQLLEQKAQLIVRDAVKIGAIKAEVKIPLSQEIYNRAIGLARGQRTVAPTGNTASDQGVDITGDINFREREAVAVCKRSLPELRDKLLKSYAWEFAKKTASLTAATKVAGWSNAYIMPTDCVRVLAVLSGDEPIEWELSDGLILCNSSTEITARYIKSITDISQFDAVFKNVLCYELAQEVSSALTWNAEQITLLEQKKLAIIQDAQRNGIIKEESRIPLKDGILKRAVMFSEGVKDSDNVINNGRYLNSITIARSCYDSVRDRLLQLYPWVFARKNATLAAGSELPSNVLTVLAVFVDNSPIEFERIGRKLNVSKVCEYCYTARITDETEWDGAFKDLFCYELAKEVVTATTADASILQVLEQKSKLIINQAYKSGVIKSDTVHLLTEELHNRAITLSHGTRNLSGSGNTANEQGLDIAGEQNTRTIDEINACTRAAEDVEKKLFELYPWTFTKKNATLTASTTIAGWSNGYTKPSDCLNVLCVIVNNESVDFEQTSDKIFCNGSNASVRYTTRISDKTKWPSLFRDLYCYMLAVEVVLATTANVEVIQVLEMKAAQIIQQAYDTGLIKDETNIPITEEIYRRAIMLSEGVRDIPAVNEQGQKVSATLQHERRVRSLAIAKASYESVRDRTLQLYPWVFARKKATIAAGGNLPSDLLNILAVLVNGSPVEFERVDSHLSVNQDCEVHYVAKITDSSKWDGTFKDVFCYELAKDIVMATTADSSTLQLLEQKIQLIVSQAYKTGVLRADTYTQLTDELYNRAIGLSRGQRTLSGSGNAANEQGLDISGQQNVRTVEEVAACKRASENVRLKLLQLYPWVFAKREDKTIEHAGLSGWQKSYEIPYDCLNVLCVIANNEPVEFELTENRILCNHSGASIRYIADVADKTKWSASFKDAYCYSLAVEVALAVTGNLETVQLLEQKISQIITQAHNTGLIKAETRITLSEELYNRAISLVRGQWIISPTSDRAVNEGQDSAGNINDRSIKEINVCKRSSDSVRDKLLGLYPWLFARKSIALTDSETISGWEYGYTLPSDCLTVLTVLFNGEPIDFEVVGDRVYCNGSNASIRYTAKMTDMSTWPGIFADAFCYELAQEIISATTGNNEQVALLEQKKQALIVDAYKSGIIKFEARVPVKEELFNRAIGLVKGQKREQQPDIINSRYEDEISACKQAFNSVRDRLLQMYSWTFAKKTDTPARLSDSVPGWKYTYILPDDCLKVVAVIAPDRRAEYNMDRMCMNNSDYPENIEIVDYETNNRELYVNREIVYVRYTALIEDYTKWNATFTDIFVLMLAIEIAMNITDNQQIIQSLEQRTLQLIENAKENGLIKEDTGLPKQNDSMRLGFREKPYLDYSGIPTRPCTKLSYYEGCGGYYEGFTSEFCKW